MKEKNKNRVRSIRILFSILLFSILCSGYLLLQQQKVTRPDGRQYPKGFNHPTYSALVQLQNYPAPRYKEGNTLLRLFNWMDPFALGGNSQKGVSQIQATKNAVDLQEELGLNWNYNIVIPNSSLANSEAALQAAGNPTLAYINLANKYPQIPLGVVTIWMQVKPAKAGFKDLRPTILSKDLPEKYYTHMNWNGKDKKEINYNFPDSLIDIDGKTQKFYLQNILKHLTRPIDIVNENGEEPPGINLMSGMKNDPTMIEKKNRSGIKDWSTFMANEKFRMREKYIAAFMKEIPELKNTLFTIYANEGGPIDRFDWSIMKKCMSPINGNYYSTPDFYPRWPVNWKAWMGAWHGWKWIDEGRKVEIKNGDNLFSPYVSAGWSKDPSDDIRPGQWLGLLKCLATAGAEFYYVGYFNLSTPYTNPGQYVWQAAIASYAQAITSRYETELRKGHLLVDKDGEAIVTATTDEPCLLMVIRKCDDKKRYIISASMQPFNNNKNSIPESKIVTAEFDGHKLSFEARRQGSVYVYDISDPKDTIFYQLDAWHENAHPDRWSKDLYYEAEVQDGDKPLPVITKRNTNDPSDYSNYVSYIKIDPAHSATYEFCLRDTVNSNRFIHLLYYCADAIDIALKIDGKNLGTKSSIGTKGSTWLTMEVNASFLKKGMHTLEITASKGEFNLDKFIISSSSEIPVNKK